MSAHFPPTQPALLLGISNTEASRLFASSCACIEARFFDRFKLSLNKKALKGNLNGKLDEK